MIESKTLGSAAGIQYQGVIDKSEGTVLPSLANGVIAGKFKRGRMDKPFKVTASNYKALLGHDPSNPSYLAVEDAFKRGVSEISILRVGQTGGAGGAIDTEMPEVEAPWPPELVLPVKLKAEADSSGELPVVINFEGGSAQVDFGDGSDVLSYTDSVEHTYPASPVEGELVPYSITLTPTSRIPLLSTDIQELTDWGSAGSVKRFKFTHMKPKLPENIAPWITDTSYMFEGCRSLESVSNLSAWNMSNVLNTSGMFLNANTYFVDLSNWDVSNVTDMSHMFEGDNSLSTDFSGWNVSSVTNMRQMFKKVGTYLLGVGNWDVSNVIDMSGMFHECGSLRADLSSWNVSNVIDMSSMFYQAYNFNSDLSNWDVSNVTDMSHMFERCSELFGNTGGDPSAYWSLEKWDVGQVTNMERMFYQAYGGVPSNISNWNTSNVTNMKETFVGCSRLNHLTNWDTSKVTTMEGMFEDIFGFNGDLTNWDVSNVINMDRMFAGVRYIITSLDKWCVEKIPEEPIDFMDNASYMHPQNKPVWGTCPKG